MSTSTLNKTGLDRAFRPRTADILYLRFVEMVSLAVIVFGAKLLASFTYPFWAIITLFAAAVVLHYGGGLLAQGFCRGCDWTVDRRDGFHLMYASYVDLMLVLGIIYLTGTIESPFLFTLIIPLFFAAHAFPSRTTVIYFLAPALALLGLAAILEFNGLIPHYTCYWFETGVFSNPHFVAGSLLVVGAFCGLVLFLTHSFKGHFMVSLERLTRKGEESESKIHELTRLYDISLGINSAMSIDTLLKIVAKEVTLLLNKPWASIVLFNPRQEITHSVFVGVNQKEEVKLDRRIRRGGLSEWIWTHSAPIVVENTARDKRANCSEFLNRYGIRSVVGYPLTAGPQVVGVVYTGEFSPRCAGEEELRLLSTLATQLTAAIEKSRLYESLERKIRAQERRVEALEKTNILKSDFVTHVSHELRTPLTSMKAYLETLTTHIEDTSFSQRSEFLGIVSKETERLIRIVGDILDVSKIEFGERPLQRSQFGLHSLVDDIVSMLAPTLAEKNMKVELHIADTLPRIDADEDLMRQVFINLITNAVKYSPEGTTVTVSAVEEAVDIVVTVADQGIGIPEDEVEHVFDKYFRVRSDKTASFEGVGLGLAIVKNIVEQHGGAIRVESEEGVGSNFIFSIPREHCFNDLIGYIAEVVDAREQLHDMLELIVRMIAELLSAKIVSLMLLDQNRSELFIKLSYGLDEWIVENTRVKVGEGIAGKVVESGQPLFISNIEENDVFTCPNNPQYETVSLLSVPLVVSGVVVGVINVNNKTDGKPFAQDDFNLLISFGERISRALERVRVVEDSRSFLEDTIEAFRRMLDTQVRTRTIEMAMNLAVKTSRKLGLSSKEVSVVQYVASVHDIGMTEISDEILDKALNLTSEELEQIREHPQRGAELIRPLEFVESVSNIILYHHERVDGSGYPMGLRGDQIPIGARILAVIDAYQSMTTGRPYKPAVGSDDAVAELVDCAGRQFDADVVQAFIGVLKEEGRLSSDREDLHKRALRSAVTTRV
jgi:signal transduction histidine kinase/HD-GYP domain-containing protein (c-di-GMP phosphodiesterase class II)